MSDFEVLSSIHNYNVEFEERFDKSLMRELADGDVIIIDKVVRDLYGARIDGILKHHDCITIEATEEQKSYLQLSPIIENLIKNSFRKNNRLIAIGGGVTQDVTAFIASIMYRGVGWIFYPTTLLAQGDSCIGSKTSINFGNYKNQLGNFYPPLKVVIDLSFLDSLHEMEIRSGLGEMCHFFAISGEEDFERFRSDYQAALEDKRVLRGLVARSLEIKKGYVEIDEFDKKERQILNYGHSFGHAIESLTNYEVPHGIAVCYGMDIANFISVKLGYISEELRQRIRSLLSMVWDGVKIDNLDLADYEAALLRDKKNVDGELRLILTRGLGNMFKVGIPLDNQFSGWLREYFKEQLV